MKKIVSLFAMFIVVLTIVPFTVSASNDVQVFINGTEQQFDQPPILKSDTTYLPIRHIVQGIGSKIDWEKSTGNVRIYKGQNELVFKIGDTKAFVNGVEKEIPASFMANNRTMVPIRFISEQLGLIVEWDKDKQHVHIKNQVVESKAEQSPNQATRQLVILTEQEKKQAAQLLNDASRIARIEQMIEEGTQFLGVPYQYGAKVGDTSSFDCSSFIAYLFQQQNIPFPRVASDQATMGMKIPFETIERGDLLFFDTALNGNIEHVGIYLGNNEMLHVSTSKGVQITQLFDYWQERYVVATRF